MLVREEAGARYRKLEEFFRQTFACGFCARDGQEATEPATEPETGAHRVAALNST